MILLGEMDTQVIEKIGVLEFPSSSRISKLLDKTTMINPVSPLSWFEDTQIFFNRYSI
jgi:hypothetical protein